MKRVAAANPDAYEAELSGWRQSRVAMLRQTIASAVDAEECIKWGNIVLVAEGPAMLIRAESERVLLGFWRGLRLFEFEPRLKPSGKYEMASLVIGEHTDLEPDAVAELARRAVELNRQLGNPQLAASRSR